MFYGKVSVVVIGMLAVLHRRLISVHPHIIHPSHPPPLALHRHVLSHPFTSFSSLVMVQNAPYYPNKEART